MRPSPALAVAIVAVLVAASGQDAYATAQNFLLGTSNTETAQTSLDGSTVAGRALQLTNTNTSSGATALGLTVAAGHPPFTVSAGAGKVVNLNADKLDGLDSSQLIQGKGAAFATAIALPPGSIPWQGTVAPGLAALELRCTSGSPPAALVQVQNVNSGSVNVFDSENTYDGNVASGDFVQLQAPSQGSLWTIGVQGIVNGTQAVTTITVGAVYRQASNDCHFQVQATTGNQ